MVSLIHTSPLGRNGTFGTPLKGDVPSCPAFGPSYGRTFYDNVTPCPVLSRSQGKQLKFWIKSAVKSVRSYNVGGKFLTPVTYVLRPRQIISHKSIQVLPKVYRSEYFQDYCVSGHVRIVTLLFFGFIQCVETFQNMRVAVSVKTKRIDRGSKDVSAGDEG